MTNEKSKLLTRKEAAAHLGLRPQTLAAWAVTGKYNLPFIKVGRSVRYRLTDLKRWLVERTLGPLAGEEEEAGYE